jgi:seryl-tRNA(Sec) selenium transferase
VASKARIGGGALPRSVIPSVALEFASSSHSPNELATLLRRARPPIIGYLAQGQFQLDLRTIFKKQDELVVAALTACLTTQQE